MQQIYDDKAVQIVAAPGGIIMVVTERLIENQAVVSYKYYDFASKQISKVTRDVYFRGKFGEQYSDLVPHLNDFVNQHVANLPDHRTLFVYPTGEASVYDENAKKVWNGNLNYKELTPCDAVCIGRSVWVSFPEGDTILRYNARTLREELRIGSKKDNAFSRPCGLYANGSKLIVCNSVSNCVEVVDTDTYTVERYASFDEPVYQYVKSGEYEVVRLASGVYLM